MLAHRHRRWAKISPALGQCVPIFWDSVKHPLLANISSSLAILHLGVDLNRCYLYFRIFAFLKGMYNN